MLSVGSRDDGRKRSLLGLEGRGGAERSKMEENELEEGEAYLGQDDDIDPDDLSYIDIKIQNVLGHFQKEFEGGVSAESLGPKYGGYGSFLPAYQRSPPIKLSQPKSPVKVPNNLSSLPHNLQSENASIPLNASSTKVNDASAVQQIEKCGKRDICNRSFSAESISQHESTKQSLDTSLPKSLKVRIKVGPDNVLIRKKPEIYSDLGLDVSPSPEDSPVGSREISPESPDAFVESPSTILQVMTHISVPGNFLLSPLSENLLHLFEKEDISVKNFKKSTPQNVVPETCAVSSGTSLQTKDSRDFTYKENKSIYKSRKLLQEDVVTTKLKNEIGRKTQAAQNVVSDQETALASCGWSANLKEEMHLGGNSIKEYGMFDSHNETNMTHMMERAQAPDLRKENHLEFSNCRRMDESDNPNKEINLSNGKKYSKPRILDKALKETSSNLNIPRKSMSKIQKNLDKKESDYDNPRMRKDYSAEFEEFVNERPQPAQKACSSENKMMQDKVQSREDGQMIKGNQNEKLVIEVKKEKQNSLISAAPKGVKKMANLKGSHLEAKSKMSRSHMEINKDHNVESQSELLFSAQDQQIERSHVSVSSLSNEKSNEKADVNKSGGFCNAGTATNVQAPLIDAVPPNDVVSAIPAVVLIEDNWVLCDVCQTWRLLPYGIKPESLPRKWQCSMQDWLPGLNNCKISQDEATKAFHELYQFPAPGIDNNVTAHLSAAASGITSADAINPGRKLKKVFYNAPLNGNKKHGLMDATDLPNDSTLTNVPKSSKNLLTETDSSIKTKPVWTSKSEKYIHKQKDKHTVASSYKVQGESSERSGNYSKSMMKRRTDDDGHRTSKKIKKDGSYQLIKDLHSCVVDTSGKIAANGDSEFSTKAPLNCKDHSSKNFKSKSGSSKKPREEFNSSNAKHKRISSAADAEKTLKYDSNDKKRKLKEWQDSQVCQRSMSSERVAGSKHISKEVLIDGESRRQKKTKVVKSDGKDSRAVIGDGNIEMKNCSTRVALSSNKKHHVDVTTEGLQTTDEQVLHFQGNATSGQTLESLDGLKQDVAYMSSHAAATSSSSKISGSQKGKLNLPETKGSPVESVSSSPMKILSTENNSVGKNSLIKDNAISLVYSGMGSPKRFSDGEFDGSSGQSKIRVKDPSSNDCLRSSEIYRSAESGALDFLRVSHDCEGTEPRSLTGGKVIDGRQSKVVKRDDVMIMCDNGNAHHHSKKHHLERPEKNHMSDEVERCTSDQKNYVKSSSDSREKHKSLNFDSDKGKLKVFDTVSEQKDLPSMKTCNSRPNAEFDKSKKDNFENHFKQHKSLDLRTTIASESRSKSTSQQNLQNSAFHERQNPLGLLIAEAIDEPVVDLGKGVQLPNQAKDKLEKKVWGNQKAPEPINKDGNLEKNPVDAVNSEALKTAKPSRNLDELNGTSPNLLRPSTASVPRSSSPLKKDGHPNVNIFIKEARDLKHTANRLKKLGLEDESSGIFFESALKFLHAAFLLEPPNAESTRQGELVPSTQVLLMYYETAKFCEFCAHEYERLKEMAAAALAYKCAEVAYLKVAYYKNPSAIKDRIELQIALDAPMPGESPSASASDVDNLNIQGNIDKVTSSKAVCSPQIAGNHAIAARNRPHVMRLLTYTNYLNCAFDATKKSQNAIAAAITDQGKSGIDMCSARKVLDFNFHNVEGLLRLVRLSMNSIGH